MADSGQQHLPTAANFILSGTSPGAKALVIATDITRFMVAESGDALSEDWSFAEPSGGAGAVAMIVSDTPHVFQIDVGASGYYGYEVMDTCRPLPDSEAGNADLSLLSYLDCCENSFREYQRRVGDVDFVSSFGYLAFHTPFGGMIKGAHRNLMRKVAKARPAAIEEDFQRRMHPGLTYCQRVGNVMGATTMLSLASTIDNADLSSPQRIGVFSYGSGCCSEFFSGVSRQESQDRTRGLGTEEHLGARYELTMPEYDALLQANHAVKFGTRNALLNTGIVPQARTSLGRELLFLEQIDEFHREYQWLS